MPDRVLTEAALLFDGRRLTQARHLRGKLKSEIAATVDVSPAAIGQFERGTVRPRPATLAKIALTLGLAPGFFARPLTCEIPEDEAHFRRLRGTSKRDRDEARARVEILADFVEALERRVQLPQPQVPMLESGVTPEEAADATRRAWGLGDGPIGNVVGLLERKGVIVARLEVSSDDVDAFSCWVGGRPYVLLTSNKNAPDRSRFDAAHELGHLVLHQDAQPGNASAEQEAHRFAAEFLMPAAVIRAELPTRLNWRRYLELKLRWGTSLAALVRRAKDVRVISDSACQRAMIELGRRGWRREEPGVLLAPETPELIGRALTLLEQERRIVLEDFAAELQLPVGDLRALGALDRGQRLSVAL